MASNPTPATGERPRVWHYRDRNIPSGAVYVGRPTKWGNPYVIGRDGSRAEVIAQYRDDLLRGNGRLLADVCWCAPQPCHADVLLEMANA